MCNGYPAPRCSRHALNLLEDARLELENSSTWAEKEHAERKLRKAEEVFYMTPAGFETLEMRLETENNPLVKDELFAKLIEGKNRRKVALRNAAHIKRVNKDQLTKAKEMRSTGLPNWVVGSQLNVEFLESDGKTVEKEINVKTKSFILTVEDKKVLSITNKFSLDLGDYTVEHPLGKILNSFKNRGSNAPIDPDELTYTQKNLLLNYVKDYLVEQEFTEIIVSDPRIGYSVLVPVEEVIERFSVTLYTPTAVRTGTDNLPVKNIDDFVSLFKHELVAIPEKVDKQIIIETTKPLEPEQLYVEDKYYLTHLKDNFYSVKKLGKVTSHTLRCVLIFNN